MHLENCLCGRSHSLLGSPGGGGSWFLQIGALGKYRGAGRGIADRPIVNAEHESFAPLVKRREHASGTAEAKLHGMTRPKFCRNVTELAAGAHFLHKSWHMGLEAHLGSATVKDKITMWDTFDLELSNPGPFECLDKGVCQAVESTSPHQLLSKSNRSTHSARPNWLTKCRARARKRKSDGLGGIHRR